MRPAPTRLARSLAATLFPLWYAHAVVEYVNHIYSHEHSGCKSSHHPLCKEFIQNDRFGTVFDDEDMYPRPFESRRRSAVLHGTAMVQNAIWKHQNPSSCEGKSFLIVRPERTGIGSHLVLLGRALGYAMTLGKILAYWPRPDRSFDWYDPATCANKSNFHCWFQDLTNCSLGTDHMSVRMETLLRHGESIQFMKAHWIPPAIWPLFNRCSCVKPRMRHYWWAAQAVTYIARFNTDTLVALARLRSKRLRMVLRGSQKKRRLSGLPPGTVAMHVRHGDKFLEGVPSLPFNDYVEAAEALASVSREQRWLRRVLHPQLADGNRSFSPGANFVGRHLFLSTEDHAVVEEALNRTMNKGGSEGEAIWDTIFNIENRSNAAVFHMFKQRGPRAACMESFLNLVLSLEADAWVCTLTSAWCNLIDVLRMTLAGKADAPFINLVPRGYRRGQYCDKKMWHRWCYTIL